jgi:DNA polymerase-1
LVSILRKLGSMAVRPTPAEAASVAAWSQTLRLARAERRVDTRGPIRHFGLPPRRNGRHEMTGKAEKPHRLYLVDGSGYIFRAFHALPPMSRPDGTPVNAVFGFTNMLAKLIDDASAEYLAVVFDTARKTFRNKIFPEYKAHRPEPPEELIPQFALVREATRAFNVASLEMEGYEADDIIATLAHRGKKAGLEVIIVSSDKDLMQLVNESVRMQDPVKNRAIGRAEVIERFGVGPERVVDVQALAGDSTDNVPGVPGIGVKTAAELINAYGDLDSLLARTDEIKQPKRRENLAANAELARISRELVRLRDDVPLKEDLHDLAVRKPDPKALFQFLETQGFKSTMARLHERYGGEAVPALRPVPKKVATQEYVLVTAEADLDEWIAAAFDAGTVAVDTETTSLNSMLAELVGISLSVEPGRACYIPVGHVAPAAKDLLDAGDRAANAPKQIARAAAITRLKPMLEDRSVLKVGHNIKYDAEVFARCGVRLAPIDDTMILSYVLDGGLHGHGLKDLTQLHLDRKSTTYEEVAGTGKSQISFAEVPLDAARDYAAADADNTIRLHRVLKPRLQHERMVTVYETIERPLIPILCDMERAGVKVDAKALRGLSADFDRRAEELEKEIHRLAGHEFNVGSPKQLGEVLFDEMSLPGGVKGKTGAYATGADVLETLSAQGHDLPARVLDWRQVTKLKSTYTDALVQEINPETGRVHTSFAQAVASTGRLSSNDPNLQNIPVRTEEGRKIRHAFVADEGCVLLSADYSQIELRLLAHVADIKTLKEAFRKGADIHAMTASEVFGVPISTMTPETRNRAKAINFGIIYGISAFGLARQLGIPQGDAKRFIDAYFQHYPGIRDYMEATKAFAREHGYVVTIFGRRCHVPGIKDKNPAKRSFSERAAINAPLQGAAADIIKRAMIRVPEALKRAKLGARMLLQVHDELVFEVPEPEAKKTAETVRRTMEEAAQLSVPLVVETGTGDNWADAH